MSLEEKYNQLFQLDSPSSSFHENTGENSNDVSFLERTIENSSSPSYSPWTSTPSKTVIAAPISQPSPITTPVIMASQGSAFQNHLPSQQIPKELESIKSELTNCDSEHSLAIWLFIETYDSDIQVRDYVEKILKYSFFPIEPDLSQLSKLSSPNFELESSTQVDILRNFTTYFQKKNFVRNTSGAIDKKFPMFNTFSKFTVPHYHQLPLQTFKDICEAKKQLALSMQTSYVQGVCFTMELMLLRNFAIISEAVNAQSNDVNSIDIIKYFFITFFAKAKTNYLINSNVKNIDWSKKITTCQPPLPNWRKTGGKPPINAKNIYAEALCKRVTDGVEKITSLSVLQDIKSKGSQGGPKPHNDNNLLGQGNQTVKQITKQPRAPPPRRHKKDNFMKKRNIGESSQVLDFDKAFTEF